LAKINLSPLPVEKERKLGSLCAYWIAEAIKEIPGASGKEKKAWVKAKIDDLFALPPVAEQISDFIISISVEIAYAGWKAVELQVEKNDKLLQAEAEIKKLKSEIRKLKKEIKELTDQTAPPAA